MATQNQIPTNFAAKLVGNLGHDAHVFDRTCPKCKGAYHSLHTPVCPKCGSALTYITTSENKPMSITECTFYPIFGKATRERWEKDTSRRKGGLGIVWRFKIFNYADKNGVLAEHPLTMMLKKGATVEIRCYNHPPFATGFMTKEGAPMVELMYVIFPTYGDQIKVLKQPNIVAKTMEVATNMAAPIVTQPTIQTGAVNADVIAAITAQVLATLQNKAVTPAPAPVPAKAAAPVVNASVAATAEEDLDDQILGSLYGDIDMEAMEAALPDSGQEVASTVNPWK